MEQVSKEQVRAVTAVVLAVADTVRELGEVPSGVLYANLEGSLSLEHFNKVVGLLKESGCVEETNHVLKWTGPS